VQFDLDLAPLRTALDLDAALAELDRVTEPERRDGR
jgi:hypothetical protein